MLSSLVEVLEEKRILTEDEWRKRSRQTLKKVQAKISKIFNLQISSESRKREIPFLFLVYSSIPNKWTVSSKTQQKTRKNINLNRLCFKILILQKRRKWS